MCVLPRDRYMVVEQQDRTGVCVCVCDMICELGYVKGCCGYNKQNRVIEIEETDS